MAKENKYYVYLHLNKLTNEVFYVGKGSGNRAYRVATKRSVEWNDIANSDGFKVVFALTEMNSKEADILEVKLIALYGRKDLGNGNLVNKTDGGLGVKGMITTDKQKIRMSEVHSGNTYRKGVTLSQLTKDKISKNTKGIGNILLDVSSGVYYSTIREAASILGMSEKTLNNWVTGISPNKSNLKLV